MLNKERGSYTTVVMCRTKFTLQLFSLQALCALLSAQTCELNGYTQKLYTDLFTYDYNRTQLTYSQCLSLCSVNQSCAAMSYHEEEQTCLMSSVPYFLPDLSGVAPRASLKVSHSSDLEMANVQDNLVGQNVNVTKSSSFNWSHSRPGEIILDGDKSWFTFTDFEESPWFLLTLPHTYWVFSLKIHELSYQEICGEMRIMIRVLMREDELPEASAAETYADSVLGRGALCADVHNLSATGSDDLKCIRPMLGKYIVIVAPEFNSFLGINEIEVRCITEPRRRTEYVTSVPSA